MNIHALFFTQNTCQLHRLPTLHLYQSSALSTFRVKVTALGTLCHYTSTEEYVSHWLPSNYYYMSEKTLY